MRLMSTSWQPNAAAHSLKGIRDAIGYVRRSRALDRVRTVDGFGGGTAVPMGIRLKEGET